MTSDNEGAKGALGELRGGCDVCTRRMVPDPFPALTPLPECPCPGRDRQKEPGGTLLPSTHPSSTVSTILWRSSQLTSEWESPTLWGATHSTTLNKNASSSFQQLSKWTPWRHTENLKGWKPLMTRSLRTRPQTFPKSFPHTMNSF